MLHKSNCNFDMYMAMHYMIYINYIYGIYLYLFKFLNTNDLQSAFNYARQYTYLICTWW